MCKQSTAECRFYKKTTGTSYLQTTSLTGFSMTCIYCCAILNSGNVVVGTSSSPYCLEIWNTATDERFWEGTVDPHKLFEQFKVKMDEFQEAEKEHKLKECIKINLEMQKLMDKIKDVTRSDGGQVSKLKNRIARQIFELTKKV